VTPAGSTSLSSTAVAVDGPALWTPSVYVSSSPASTGSGAADFVSARSAAASTVVSSLAELFAGARSVMSELTVAWLVIRPPSGERTPMSTPAPAPSATVPRSHVTVPPSSVQLPWVGFAASNVTPAGRVSVTVTPVASCGPVLSTLSV
jgi:hypothetical protein